MTIHDQIQNNLNFRLMPVPNQILETEIIQTIDLETLHTIVKEIIPRRGIETIQTIGNLDIEIIDHVIILTIDLTITIIKIDHATIHTIKIQVITTDKGATLNQHIGITHVIQIHNKIIGVVHLNIKGK